MNNLRLRFATRDPTMCAICRRSASGYGYAPPRTNSAKNIIWLCKSNECRDAAEIIFPMSQKELDHYEMQALRAAIDVAGPLLDKIGTTDLAKLDGLQMDEFLVAFLQAYEVEMRRQILNHDAPF